MKIEEREITRSEAVLVAGALMVGAFVTGAVFLIGSLELYGFMKGIG